MSSMQWVCIATAPNEPIGESWAELLRNEGVPAFVRSDTVRAYVGSGFVPVRVMVHEDREQDGRVVLEELLGPGEEPGGEE